MYMLNNTFYEKMERKPFHTFYDERINGIIHRLQNERKTDRSILPSVWDGIAADLYDAFHFAAHRTLVAEFHICKDAGRLSGKTSDQEYHSYLALLMQKEYQEHIYQKYPGLCCYLEMSEEFQFAFWHELLERLGRDWNAIKKNFFPMDEKVRIVSVRRSGSDFHCNGKSVVIIETNRQGRFFYKPHALANEIFLQELLTELYGGLGLTNHSYPVLDKKTYGWVKEVTKRECKNQNEVRAFFKRAGILSAASYILGIGDLHYENIVAHGEYPVIVDAETLFQNGNDLYQWTEKTADFYSVLSSALFPGGAADGQTAGITGGKAGSYIGRVPVINEILEGFSAAYDWLLDHKNAILQNISDAADILNSRYVSGSTQFFSLTVSDAAHPDLMTDKGGRSRYISRICSGRNLFKWESEAMVRGDIPWFYRKPDDRNLYAEQGIICPDYFECTILERMQKRFEQLSEEDCALQKKILQVSMDVFCKDALVGHADPAGCAENITEYIARNMIRQRDKIFWLGLEDTKKRIRIKPVDIYFYSGIAGIAVYFRKFYQSFRLHENICESLEQMLFSYTDRIISGEILPVTEYPGMYCGEGSVVYAYQLLFRITGKDQYRDYAGRHCRILSKFISQEKYFDLLYGNAGAVLVFCRQYADTGDRFYLDEAHRALDFLERSKIESGQGVTWYAETEGNPVCSIAHGNSGILLAYARINSLSPTPSYIECMRQIVKYENQFWDEESGNWADFRKNGEERHATYAWCNGGVGIAYARIQALKWNPAECGWMRAEIEKAARLLTAMPERSRMCLCHGNVGNYLILKEAADVLKDEAVERKRKVFLELLKKKLLGKTPVLSIQEMVECGFMNGAAGVGMALLLCEELSQSS